MLTPQLILDVYDELVIDNFAGGGGASTGIERALGRHVDHAINHDKYALGMHRINHPQTIHHREDVFAVNPRDICEGRPVGHGWFSPDCKHFSKAKGGKPLSKKIRGLAFIILRWAKYGTRRIFMENVEEITTWGPLKRMVKKGKRGMYPDPAHKGRTWLAFLAALSTGIDATHPDLDEMVEVLTDKKDPSNSVTRAQLIRGFGYHFEWRKIKAYHKGAGTIRQRLFLIARNDGVPIIWPEHTHFSPKEIKEARRLLGRSVKPWKPMATCIDWTQPCHSIFLNKAQAKAVRCRRPLVPSTLRRIATGIDRYVLKSAHPFIVNLTHQGDHEGIVESIEEPLKTITGANRGEKALVTPNIMRHFGESIGQGVDAPAPTTIASGGGKTALIESSLAPFLTEHANASDQRNCDVVKPGPTITAETKRGSFALISGTLVHTAHGEQDSKGRKRGRGSVDLNEPLPSILATQDTALAAATMVQTGYGERPGQKPRCLDLKKPLGTIVGDGKHATVAAHMIQTGHLKSNSKMIKGADEPLRTQVARPEHGLIAASLAVQTTGHSGGKADEPLKTIATGGHHTLVASNLVKLRGDVETHPQAPDLNDPAHTISADGTHHGIASAFMVQNNNGFNRTPHHPVTKPCSTITGAGSGQGLIKAKLANTCAYYGNDKDGQSLDESARTVTTKERFGLVESEAIAPGLTPEQMAGALRVAAFLREHGVEILGDYATLTIASTQFVIVDIGMRMLTARELFRAQGFGENYIIDRAWLVNPKTGGIKEINLTKEQQIRMCGNSVCPDVAAALVKANTEYLNNQRSDRSGLAREKRHRPTCAA